LIELTKVINDLADWIEDAFKRYQEKDDSLPGNLNNAGRKSGISTHTPLTEAFNAVYPSGSSETETDDSGITFVPKKYHPSRTSSIDDDSDHVASRFSPPARNIDPHPGAEFTDSRVKGEGQPIGDGETKANPEVAANSKLGPPLRQVGQTISETELMRRRRLLDSHLIEKGYETGV
jgi:hypothetical protein